MTILFTKRIFVTLVLIISLGATGCGGAVSTEIESSPERIEQPGNTEKESVSLKNDQQVEATAQPQPTSASAPAQEKKSAPSPTPLAVKSTTPTPKQEPAPKQEPKPQSQNQTSLTKTIVDTIKAKDILDEFDSNALDATAKYKDQTFGVTGIVKQIDFNYAGFPYIDIGSGAMFESWLVRCYISDVTQASDFSEGKEITVVGTFLEWDYEVTMTPCSVPGAATDTSTQEAVAEIVKAKDILDEFDSNALAATAKYKDQTFGITGIVKQIDFNYAGFPYIDIGSGAVFESWAVRCYISDVTQASIFSEGDEIMVEGTFLEWDFEVTMNPCSVPGASSETGPQEAISGIVKAKDILDEFDSNALAATAKYKDQTFNVNGIVKKIDSNYSGSPYIDIGSGAVFESWAVRCYIPSPGQAANFSEGDEITVEGTFLEWDFEVTMNPCSVPGASSETGPQEAITGIVKAKDILDQFDSNALSATAKYKDQTFSLNGIIKKIDFNYNGMPFIEIGSGAAFESWAVRCYIPNTSQASNIYVGDEITVEGTFLEWDYEVTMNPCSVPGATSETIPQVTVTGLLKAKDILDQFDSNAVEATSNYKNQTFRVIGIVKKIDSDYNGLPFIDIGSGAAFESWAVRCYIPDAEQSKNYEEGSEITVEGTFLKWDYEVTMNPCSVPAVNSP